MYRMSIAQFNGINTPITIGSTPDTYWKTYLTTPDQNTNITLPSGATTTVYTSPILPQGYWNINLPFYIDSSANLANIQVSFYNESCPPSALPIFGNPTISPHFSNFTIYDEWENLNQTEMTSNISGMVYSDGTEKSKVKIDVYFASSVGGTNAYWGAIATSYYNGGWINLFKIG